MGVVVQSEAFIELKANIEGVFEFESDVRGAVIGYEVIHVILDLDLLLVHINKQLLIEFGVLYLLSVMGLLQSRLLSAVYVNGRRYLRRYNHSTGLYTHHNQQT